MPSDEVKEKKFCFSRMWNSFAIFLDRIQRSTKDSSNQSHVTYREVFLNLFGIAEPLKPSKICRTQGFNKL
jgi:hypothetical protein